MSNGEYIEKIVEQDEDYCILRDDVAGIVTIEVSLEWWNKPNTKWELKENPIVIERSVLDEIRAEIIKLQTYKLFEDTEKLVALDEVLQIIDKYRGESKDACSD